MFQNTNTKYYFKGDGLCYRVVKATEGVTKEKAEEACEEIGGTLIGKVLQEDGVFEWVACKLILH